MNTNSIINLDNSINKIKEHEENLKRKALNMQLKVLNNKLHLNDLTDDFYNVKNTMKMNDKIIQEKMEILSTRDQQLQDSINKTIFDKKVFYVILTLLIALIVTILLVYSFVI
jgi:hypothetical protein